MGCVLPVGYRWKADIAPKPPTNHDGPMSGYQCWFCGQGVERADSGAVVITVESLWRWDAGSRGDDDPLQSVYAHSRCAKDRLQGATMALEPHIFGGDD
jgi:hypothetical protein